MWGMPNCSLKVTTRSASLRYPLLTRMWARFCPVARCSARHSSNWAWVMSCCSSRTSPKRRLAVFGGKLPSCGLPRIGPAKRLGRLRRFSYPEVGEDFAGQVARQVLIHQLREGDELAQTPRHLADVAGNPG